MDSAAAALVPPWLDPLLRASFFSTCRQHGDAARSECNMFCIDCPDAAAFCFYCRSSYHSDHRTIQIRRSSYHDVVRVAEVQRFLDIAGVQTYVINSARVLFLNERPQPRGGGSTSSASAPASSSATKALGGGPHICEICFRTLLDPFRFCSLGCKLERIKRKGDACFVPEEGGEDDEEDEPAKRPSTARGGEERLAKSRWRRRGRTTSTPATGGGGGESGQAAAPAPPSASSSAGATSTSTTSHSGNRRRKGVPHRSPLAS